MNIIFYNFSKKENSTARPTDTGDQMTCSIKTPASIQAPVVELHSDVIPVYNYAYIPDMARYYFVTGTMYNRGVWEISLRCDVLASFKDSIGTASLYIERASAAQNGSLIDRLYPVTDNYTVNNVYIAGGNVQWQNGAFIVNVLDGNSNSGNTSYQFTASNFGRLIDAIMVTGADSYDSVWDSITQSIKVTMFEPLKYINSVYWFPEPFSVSAAGVSTLKLGNFTATGFTCYPVSQQPRRI